MQLVIQATDASLELTTDSKSASIALTPTVLEQMRSYCQRYQHLRHTETLATLLALGQELFEFINAYPPLLHAWLHDVGTRQLEISVKPQPRPIDLLLLNMPWEILAYQHAFLAQDQQLYVVTRRLGQASHAAPPAPYKDLTLIFMAADPRSASGLNYEQEEKSILSATRQATNLNLIVEESGNLTRLTQRISESKYCDMVHLSCHGRLDSSGNVLLQLENEQFGLEEVGASEFGLLAQELKCLFLSACHSAEGLEQPAFTLQLARLGIANVIGWDGSIADNDATLFASEFYKALALGSTVPLAIAYARQSLLRQYLNTLQQALEQQKGRYWHLGRSYINAQGGYALVDKHKPSSPKLAGHSSYELLDKLKGEVRVASRHTFIGRRLAIKTCLQHFHERHYAGILLYGMGGAGKSSLAARIAERLGAPYKTVVIYKHYQAIHILTALQDLLPDTTYLEVLEKLKLLKSHPEIFKRILKNLLESHFNEQPIFLMVDDLEQHILEQPSQGQTLVTVKPAFQEVLAGLIQSFDEADTRSRLLLTSRYRFHLSDPLGNQVAQRLYALHVDDFTPFEQERQWLALIQNTPLAKPLSPETLVPYLKRIYQLSAGNAGLQDVLCRPLIKGELGVLTKALDKIDRYHASQSLTTGTEDVDKYLQRIALDTYSQALTDSERALLQVLTTFEFPVPEAVLIQVAPRVGIDDPVKALQRLDNLGLLMHYAGEGLEQHLTCHGLVRRVVDTLSVEDKHYIAMQCAPVLWQIWFKELLEQYAIPEFEALHESIDYIRKNHFHDNYQGKLPLQTFIDQTRISYLHHYCIHNSLINWEELRFSADEFINRLDLSLSLHIFEKLMFSSRILNDLSVFQLDQLYDIFEGERKEFQKFYETDFHTTLGLIIDRFSARPHILSLAYEIYFPNLVKDELALLNAIELDNEESHYKTALKIAKTPRQQAEVTGNFANFLHTQKHDYTTAETLYQRALDADPKNANTLGNFANLVWQQKHDYTAAEAMYQRAFQIDPTNANRMGNYAKLLFVMGQHPQAQDYLNQAQSQPALHPDLQTELAFYRYAHCAPYTLQPLKGLLQAGQRSLGWNLNDNVSRAQQDGHPDTDLLAALAQVISGEQDLTCLDAFTSWTQDTEYEPN